MSWAALTEQLRDLAAGFSTPCADEVAAAVLVDKSCHLMRHSTIAETASLGGGAAAAPPATGAEANALKR